MDAFVRWAATRPWRSIVTAAAFVVMQMQIAAGNELGAGGQPQSSAGDAMANYLAARASYEEQAAPYWDTVAKQRKARGAKRRSGEPIGKEDYVLEQPPRYLGPENPSPQKQPDSRPAVPTKTDFLAAALDRFHFVPKSPASEMEFKSAYAKVAIEGGITSAQAVRVYAFEAGGNGTYDVQAGLEYPVPGARAISTAFGYNQLLATNSVELLAEHGPEIIAQLEKMRSKAAGGQPDRAADLLAKIEVVTKMVGIASSVPDDWSQHEVLATTPDGLGIHALNLDVDVGPFLQTLKLRDSIEFARAKGMSRELTAAELEMMNLTGDGNGFDMIDMPQELRPVVPTSNFFQRNGYERNPVAIRNPTVAALLTATDAKMDKESALPGAIDMLRAFQSR